MPHLPRGHPRAGRLPVPARGVPRLLRAEPRERQLRLPALPTAGGLVGAAAPRQPRGRDEEAAAAGGGGGATPAAAWRGKRRRRPLRLVRWAVVASRSQTLIEKRSLPFSGGNLAIYARLGRWWRATVNVKGQRSICTPTGLNSFGTKGGLYLCINVYRFRITIHSRKPAVIFLWQKWWAERSKQP